MHEFLELLAQYYVCDASALIRPMSGEELASCAQTYDAVKAWFAPFDLAARGTLERHAQMQQGYLGFVAWQQANPDLVATMRETAMLHAQGILGVMLR